MTATAVALGARGGEPYPCDPSRSPGPNTQEPAPLAATAFAMDGDLYAVVMSAKGGMMGGWSGPPVLSIDGAFRWATALGVGKSLFMSIETAIDAGIAAWLFDRAPANSAGKSGCAIPP